MRVYKIHMSMPRLTHYDVFATKDEARRCVMKKFDEQMQSHGHEFKDRRMLLDGLLCMLDDWMDEKYNLQYSDGNWCNWFDVVRDDLKDSIPRDEVFIVVGQKEL